jgi:hypothetical protein
MPQRPHKSVSITIEMTSNEAIDYSGLIQDLLDFGFTTPHVLSEVIDDCFGAGAMNIDFHINTTDHEMLIVDNAKGMTDNELVLSHRLFKRTEASDVRQGRFGIGSKVAKVHLTQYRQPTTVISKTATSEINQITVDWSKAVQHNTLELVATEASRRNEDLWNKYCVGTGTVARIPLHPKIEKEIIASLEDGTFKKYFSRMYSKDLLEGKVIKFLYNDKIIVLEPTDILELDTCTFKQSTEVEIWLKEDDLRLYFINGLGEKVYKNADGNQSHEEPTEFIMIDKMTIESAIKSQIIKQENEKWTDWEAEDGGIFIRRMNKVIEQIPIPPTTSGDYGWRCLLNTSRHVVSFNSSLDSYFGIEINKSHLKEANIDKKIISFIRSHTKDFMSKKWTYIKDKNNKKTPPRVAVPVAPQVEQPLSVSNVIQHLGGGGGTVVENPPEPVKKKTKPLPVATPIPVPTPDTKIVITNHRAENCIQISENNRIINKFPYAGQAHHTEEVLRAWLMKMGEARFKTFVSEFAVMSSSYSD